MTKRILAAFSLAFYLACLGLLLYFLTIRPGGAGGNQTVIYAITSFASGGMFMMALYGVTLYLFRSVEKAALYFTLVCLATGARFFVMDGSLTIMGLIPDFPLGAALAIRCISVGFVVIGLTGFVFEIFASPKHKKRLPFLNAMTFAVFAALTATILHGGDGVPIRLVTLLFFIFMEAYWIFVVVQSKDYKKNWLNQLYLAVMLLYMVTSIFAAFLTGLFPHTAVISAYAFVIVHIVLLSDRYARAVSDLERININLERVIDERTKGLQNINAMMKEIVGNISHDLKTPLTVMSVNLEKLKEFVSGDENLVRHVQTAYDKNLDMQRLIQNLIEVSRMEAGQSLYRLEYISLNGLLSQVQTKYGDYLETRGLSFDVTVSGVSMESGDALIYADPVKIWSVFDNIIYNAARHTEQGGITVTADAGDDSVTVTVADTGCGIAPEHLPRVFERFYKVSSSRGEGDGGSGLGLYIVRGAMEAMGGNVAIQSEPGVGTTVILTFRAKNYHI